MSKKKQGKGATQRTGASKRGQASRSKTGAGNQSQRPARSQATKKPPVKTLGENVSKRVPNGRTIKTKDKYLPVDKKGKSQKPKDKRTVAVIDSNSADELAVVRLTTQEQVNTTELPTYLKGNKKKTLFKHFVEVTDNEGNPIKIDGIRFIENGKEYDLSAAELKKISERVLKHSAQAEENRRKIEKLKSRKK